MGFQVHAEPGTKKPGRTPVGLVGKLQSDDDGQVIADAECFFEVTIGYRRREPFRKIQDARIADGELATRVDVIVLVREVRTIGRGFLQGSQTADVGKETLWNEQGIDFCRSEIEISGEDYRFGNPAIEAVIVRQDSHFVDRVLAARHRMDLVRTQRVAPLFGSEYGRERLAVDIRFQFRYETGIVSVDPEFGRIEPKRITFRTRTDRLGNSAVDRVPLGAHSGKFGLEPRYGLGTGRSTADFLPRYDIGSGIANDLGNFSDFLIRFGFAKVTEIPAEIPVNRGVRLAVSEPHALLNAQIQVCTFWMWCPWSCHP